MPERPLLVLPTAIEIVRPDGQQFVPRPMRRPAGRRQRRRLEERYQHLWRALNGDGGLMALRSDPASIAPHRAIVFEIAGSVANFYKAVRKIPGLSFVAEDDFEFAPDDDFTMLDDERLPDADSSVEGRMYLAMPTETALQDILRLYRLWRRGRKLDHGFTPWRDVFANLKDMRPWGPQDRIPDDAIALWREEIADTGVTEVRVEAEFFYQNSADDRAAALATLEEAAEELDGAVITSSVIPGIQYHAALVSLPPQGVQQLIDRAPVELVLADQVMFLRPQTTSRGPAMDVGAPEGRVVQRQTTPQTLPAIAALLDGFPVQNHQTLDGRLRVDDPDGVEPQAVVAQRHHGTAMASLILHGDLNSDGEALQRPLHVHPILYATAPGRDEETAPDKLLLDTIYRAIVRMKDPATPGGPSAPEVFIVNLSLGDRRRVFAGAMSPLGKLLDYLAHTYNLLFLISAGNVTTDVVLSGYNTLNQLAAAGADDIARVFLAFVRDNQARRSLFAPAESLNPLTIAAGQDDAVPAGFHHHNSIAPFANNGFANVSSAIGLGHRRVVKPDLLLPGGKERWHLRATNPLTLRIPQKPQGCGLRVAAPDPTGRGDLTRQTLMCGTSVATALASRAAHQIFDSMMDADGGSNLAEVESDYWPVMVKTLLVHAARWPQSAAVISQVFGPADWHRTAERADNVARLIGYGVPEIVRVMECSPSQATLVGYSSVTSKIAHEYRIPLPECLERVTDPRSIILTLGWMSPVSGSHLDYRRAQLMVDAPGHSERIGVHRSAGRQPSDHAKKRGSVIHEVYSGDDAVVFVQDGELVLRVWCREKPTGAKHDGPIRYALAVTIEAGTALPVYTQTSVRLRPVIRP